MTEIPGRSQTTPPSAGRGLLHLARLWLKLFYRLKVEGLENLPLNGPCILTPSHTGKLLADLSVFAIVLPRRVPVVFSTDQVGDPEWGVFRAAGQRSRRRMNRSSEIVPLIHGSKLDNLEESRPVLQMLLGELEAGRLILLYPEGEVSWHGRLNPARAQAAWVALHSGAPIVPCAIVGAYDMWPRWADRPHLVGRLAIRFGEPYQLSPAPSGASEEQQLSQAGARMMDEIRLLMSGP